MKANTKRWVRQQMSRSALHQSNSRGVITEEQAAVFTLTQTTDDIESIVRSKGDLFEVTGVRRLEVRSNRLGRKFLACLGRDIASVRANFPWHRFSPLFDLLERVWRSGLRAHHLDPSTVRHFNAVIAQLRADAKEDGFLAQLALIDRMVRDNSKSLLAHLDKLFAGRARNLIIRVDLNYQGELANGMPGTPHWVTAPMVQKHMQRLFSHIRRKYPSYRTYVWSTESATIRGLHIHLMVALDGNLARKDVAIGKNICDEWKRITGRLGNAFNCNGRKEFYASRGILALGLVHRDNAVKRAHLERTILYFAKRDYYIRLEMPGLKRTLGRGLLRSGKKVRPIMRREWRKLPANTRRDANWNDRTALRDEELF